MFPSGQKTSDYFLRMSSSAESSLINISTLFRVLCGTSMELPQLMCSYKTVFLESWTASNYLARQQFEQLNNDCICDCISVGAGPV